VWPNPSENQGSKAGESRGKAEYQLFRPIWGCLKNGTPNFHALHVFLPSKLPLHGIPTLETRPNRNPMKSLYFDCQISNLPGKSRAKSTTSDKQTKVVLRLHTLLELWVPMDPTNGNCVIKWGIPRINSLPTFSILKGKISLNQWILGYPIFRQRHFLYRTNQMDFWTLTADQSISA
jgi:hypothetical protein